MIQRIRNFTKNIYSNENNKLILNNAFGSVAIKGGALIISLLSLPAFINYFKNDLVLGLWFTLLSVLSWLLTFDLGIGNGLRNNIVRLMVKKEYIKIKKYISSAYIIIMIIVIFIFSISLITFPYINWNVFLNISTNTVTAKSLNITVTIIFGGILFQFLFKLITSILFALQKSALTNFLSLSTNIIIYIYISVVDFSNVTYSLISLSIMFVLAINVPLILATIYVFANDLKEAKPKLEFFKKEYALNIITLGGTFFLVQVMYMLITTTNEFLITRFVSPEMVVEYSIYIKLFSLVGTLFILALTPIWSAVTKAASEENFLWIEKLYSNLKKIAYIAILFQFLMIPFLQLAIDFWLGSNSLNVNYLYSFIFAIHGSVMIWSGVMSSIANGFGQLKIQGICFTLAVILKIPLAWYLVIILNSWIGVVLASVIAMSIYCVIQPIWLNKFIYSQKTGDGTNV